MLVTTTGAHKSGNSWLVAMLRELLGVDCLGPAFDDQDCFRVSRFLCLQDFVTPVGKAYPRNKWLANHLVLALMTGSVPTDPNDAGQGISWGRDWEQLDAILTHLARKVRWNMARGNHPRWMSITQIHESLLDHLRNGTASGCKFDEATQPTIFLQSKHAPMRMLRRQFPDAKIIQVLRDPRDAIVSYFYHDLGSLTDGKLKWFVSGSGVVDRSEWQAKFLRSRIASQLAFYSKASSEDCEGTLPVRYEDLLSDTAIQLKRIGEFIDQPFGNEAIGAVVDKFDFARLTGGREENANSFVRSATTGQWRQHFDKSMTEMFNAEYCELLVRLGYETSGQWLEELPEQSEKQFDLSRFRLRSSAIYNAEEYWLANGLDGDSASENPIQSRFPRPFDLDSAASADGGASFFEYLQSSQDSEISNWFARVKSVWGADWELDSRPEQDSLMGY